VNPKDTVAVISYLVPTNSKICFYDTTISLCGEVIRPCLQDKAAAEEIFTEAKAKGHAAIIGRNFGNGLVEFDIGNLPPYESCEVEVRCGFISSSIDTDKLFFKFPLDIYTESGSTECVTRHLQGDFHFTLRNTDPSSVSTISSNVSGSFNERKCTYSISTQVDTPALLITTSLNCPLTSEGLFSGNLLSVTTFVTGPPKTDVVNTEFVFVIDCSGSMDGSRIMQARECLDLFIRSLPEESFFNVIRFGSRHEKLFPETVPYTAENVSRALDFAKSLRSNLGGTNILAVPSWHGLRLFSATV
jgi:hypothetical protein